MDTGSCYTCGFLAKHCPGRNVPTPRFFEVEQYERESGRMFEQAVASSGPWECAIVCYRNAAQARNDFVIFQDRAGRDAKKALEVIHAQRDCSKWYQYTPGFNPAEHLTDLRMNELELKRQEFEHKMDRDNKQFTAMLDERNRKFQIILAIVLGIFAIAEVAAAIIQVAFPSGWPWLMRLLGSYSEPPIYPPM